MVTAPSRRARTVTGWSVAALLVALDVASLVIRARLYGDPTTRSDAGLEVARQMPAFVVAALVGALAYRRTAGRRVGVLLLALALGTGLSTFTESYARLALLPDGSSVPGGAVASWLSSWSFMPLVVLIGMLLLVFPTGTPPTRRWRRLRPALLASGAVATLAFAVRPGRLEGGGGKLENPIGLPASWRDPMGWVTVIATVVVLMSVLLCAASLVARWRRAGAAERQQLTWVALTAAPLGLGVVVHLTWGQQSAVGPYTSTIADVLFTLLFVSIGVAILRYRLFDVDVVVNRALVFAVLAFFVTATYVFLVVVVGGSLGRQGSTGLGWSIAATAVVAVAFAPVRAHAVSWSNRLVYGQTQSPYDVLADVGRRLGGSMSPDDVLPELARSAVAGVGAAAAEVSLFLHDGQRRAARWPSDVAVEAPGDLELPIEHDGDRIGSLVVVERAGAALTRQQRRLLGDLARNAALALSTVRLGIERQVHLAEVTRQAAELRQSRERIVAAQDAERRRLERDIHDGAQQQLVAVSLRLRTVAAGSPAPVAQVLDELREQLTDTLATLRELASGVFPPLLGEVGVAAALRAKAASSRIPVTVVDRLPAGTRMTSEVEASIYFCCLEGLQNVTKHAGAGAVATLTFDLVDTGVQFVLVDDGIGFFPDAVTGGSGLDGMADRVAAVGGRVVIDSVPGGGTRIEGWVALGDPVTPGAQVARASDVQRPPNVVDRSWSGPDRAGSSVAGENHIHEHSEGKGP